MFGVMASMSGKPVGELLHGLRLPRLLLLLRLPESSWSRDNLLLLRFKAVGVLLLWVNPVDLLLLRLKLDDPYTPRIKLEEPLLLGLPGLDASLW